MAKKRTPVSAEARASILAEISPDNPATKVAKAHGISVNTIYAWRGRKARKAQREPVTPHASNAQNGQASPSNVQIMGLRSWVLTVDRADVRQLSDLGTHEDFRAMRSVLAKVFGL